MANADLFECDDYKRYLRGRFAAGLKQADFARTIGCNPSFVSLVLNKDAHLSPEQCMAANNALSHNQEAGHFFFLLVQRARAASRDLVAFYDEQLTQMRHTRLNLKQRLQLQNSAEDPAALYYGDWRYAAVHVAVSLPTLRSTEAIARHLALDIQVVASIVDDLVTIGLLKREVRGLQLTRKNYHLGASSPLIARHHTTWRLRATTAIFSPSPQALHYSGAFTASRRHVTELRESLVKSMRQSFATIAASSLPEEEQMALNIDLFPLGTS